MTAPGDGKPVRIGDGLMVQLTRTRGGKISAASSGRSLYSRYDPEMEADRYVSHALAGQSPGTVIVLGAGLAYLTAAVRNHHQNARIIAVFFSRLLFENRIAAADLEWCAENSSCSLMQFLEHEVPDEDLDGIAVLEWTPVLHAFEPLAAECTVSLRDFLDRRTATMATERVFGNRWIRNSIANALSVQPAVFPDQPVRTVIIAAAGPSLARVVGLLSRRDSDTLLWALPSSLPVLLNAGCPPDLVVATDAGFYASTHLHALAEAAATPIVAPLSAVAAPAMRQQPVVLLDQGSWYERDLLQALELPAVQLPPHGTVAGTAWQLAAAIGAETVIYAGLDLCVHDVRSHPRGHSFDRLLLAQHRRLQPCYHVLYQRNCVGARPLAGHPQLRTSRSLRTYAAWFRSSPLSLSVPALRLRPSPVDLGMEECLTLPRSARGTVRAPMRASTETGDPTQRQAVIANCVQEWRRTVEQLPERIHLPQFGSGDADRRTLELCRTIDIAAYLRLMRTRKRRGAEGIAGAELERACDEILQSARRLFDLLEQRVERCE